MAGVWVVVVPEEQKRKQHYLFKPITTGQYGHFDLRGLAPGKYKLFSWDGVEQGEWEDTDFLKDSEEKGCLGRREKQRHKGDRDEIDSSEKHRHG